VLAHYTGWSLAEIDELPVNELIEWVELIPKEQ